MVASSTAIIENHELNIDDLLAISFHKKKEIAYRAAWMLEYIMVRRPGQFAPHINKLLELLPVQKNPSAMRHYTKIIALLTAKDADPEYKKLSETIDFDPVIEVLFTWMVDTEMLVAAKVHCMQALANLVPRYNWIKDDLLETIDYLTDIESIAFFARARQVKKQLKKSNEN
ncbi:MAG TPA: hypothetical protein VKB19_03575 [Pedobacter sp.]|nr:hypothetical protein [Pedobacter sp.]